MPNIYLRVRGPLVCVKSHHARSDLDANDNMSLHSFTFFSRHPFHGVLTYWRLGSFLPRHRSARSLLLPGQNIGLDHHQTSTRLVVRVVEHPVYGRKLIDCFTSTTTDPIRSISGTRCRTLWLNWVSSFSSAHRRPRMVSRNQVTASLLLVFTIGGVCNARRAFLMHMSGALR